MSQKGRKPNCTDQQLEVAAYTIYRNTGEWPNVEEFKKTYSCSFERARRAIDEARTTVAGASVEATHFEALAVYAGFESFDEALTTILTLQKAPSNISKMKKRELRAAVLMHCPQDYSPRATVTTLREILRSHGITDDELTNKQKRNAEIDKQSPKVDEQSFDYRFSFQEYGNERARRGRVKAVDDALGAELVELEASDLAHFSSALDRTFGGPVVGPVGRRGKGSLRGVSGR